jgi:hypothetical protein
MKAKDLVCPNCKWGNKHANGDTYCVKNAPRDVARIDLPYYGILVTFDFACGEGEWWEIKDMGNQYKSNVYHKIYHFRDPDVEKED